MTAAAPAKTTSMAAAMTSTILRTMSTLRTGGRVRHAFLMLAILPVRNATSAALSVWSIAA